MSVVRVKDTSGNPLPNCFVLATLTGNELNGPWTAAFDGERILVTNSVGSTVSLWKAADLTPLPEFTGSQLTVDVTLQREAGGVNSFYWDRVMKTFVIADGV